MSQETKTFHITMQIGSFRSVEHPVRFRFEFSLMFSSFALLNPDKCRDIT